jgi:hypothetical protein
MVGLRNLAAILCAGAMAVAPVRAQEATEGQAVVSPARVEGHVLDDETGRGIERAEVRLIRGTLDLGRPTNGFGYFAFANVQPGIYELLVNHIGYGTRRDSIEILGGQLYELELRLAVQPVELEPLVVEIVRWQVSPRLWGFYERVDHGQGDYITRDQIERRQPLRVTHLIAEVSGVSIVDRLGPSDYIVLDRYKRFDPSGRPGPCLPVVYLDGYRTGGDSLDDLVFPSDVEGVEVYSGLAEYPGEFASPDARCGVVAVWTRSAPSSDIADSGTPLWRKLVVGGGLVVVTLLVFF